LNKYAIDLKYLCIQDIVIEVIPYNPEMHSEINGRADLVID
jgi:hypothetical protein